MRTNYYIPVLPHVQKYVSKKFFNGNNHGPYKIEEHALLGKIFMAVIIDGRKADFIDKHLEMTGKLHVKLSQDMLKRSPRMNKLVTVNFFLDKLFKDALIDWILSADHYGIRPFPASKDFLQYYGIEEAEYSHDAAYRHWIRWKNSEYNKKHGQLRTKKGSIVS